MSNRFCIVPVLDLKAGQVVRARAGDRATYRPIRSPLTASSEPDAVLDAFFALAPFPCVYIADIDAIEGRGDHRRLVAGLAHRHPDVEFWVDGGIARAADALALIGDGVVPVLGSETLAGLDELQAMRARCGGARWLLSLDYRGEAFMGPAALAASGEFWPDRVIAMTLGRVGSDAGPDLVRLAGVQAVAGARQVFAAGGVRGIGDLERLAAMAVGGALVASALHDGRLPRDAVRALLSRSSDESR